MPFTSVRLSGHQICDYIWILNRTMTSDEIAFVSDNHNEPTWTVDTILLNSFNESLLAGTLSNGSSAPTAWKVYRQEVGSDTLVLAANLTDGATSFIDYNVRNNRQYLYRLFAETTSYITAPLVSDTVSTNWATWSLFDVDETSIKNAYKLNSVFVFAYDTAGGSLSNNMQAEVYNNFTRYAKVHQAKTNYYSGTLQSLLGYTSALTDDYIDDVDLETALNDFTTNGRRKFIKDVKGHIWEVAITSFSVTPREKLIQLPCDIQMGWMAVGSADGLILTN